jgi:hypothetical protein
MAVIDTISQLYVAPITFIEKITFQKIDIDFKILFSSFFWIVLNLLLKHG